LETVGLLRDTGAVAALADVLANTDNLKVKRAAMASLAMLPNPTYRGIFLQYFHDRDERLRGAAAEGLGRLKNPLDLPAIKDAWKDEGRPGVRLSLAFAQVMLGNTELSQFSPLQFLINNLNLSAYSGSAAPLLIELAREARVREALYGAIESGTKDEKIGLARVLGASGDAETVARLKKMQDDQDPAVAQAAIDAARTIRARM